MAQTTLVSERLCGDLQQPISAMAWSVDGEFLAITSTGGELLLLDFRAGCEELLRGDHDSSLDVVGFSGDGQFLMAAGHGSHPPGQRLDRCSGLAAGWLTAGQLITLNFAPILSGAATRALIAIKLIESPLTNDLRQFQKIAGGAPLAMVAVAIDRISPDLGSLCHYEIKLPLRQLIKLLKLNRAVKQVAFKPLWVEFLRRDIQV